MRFYIAQEQFEGPLKYFIFFKYVFQEASLNT